MQLSSAALLALLVWFDVVRIWHVLLLSCLTGFAQAFGGPGLSVADALAGAEEGPAQRHRPQLDPVQPVARDRPGRWPASRVASVGIAACFGLNALSFLAVIAALTALRVPHVPPATQHADARPR